MAAKRPWGEGMGGECPPPPSCWGGLGGLPQKILVSNMLNGGFSCNLAYNFTEFTSSGYVDLFKREMTERQYRIMVLFYNYLLLLLLILVCRDYITHEQLHWVLLITSTVLQLRLLPVLLGPSSCCCWYYYYYYYYLMSESQLLQSEETTSSSWSSAPSLIIYEWSDDGMLDKQTLPHIRGPPFNLQGRDRNWRFFEINTWRQEDGKINNL